MTCLTRRIPQRSLPFLVGLALVVCAIVASVSIGARVIGIDELIRFFQGESDGSTRAIIGDLRISRTLSALVCGGALGVSGVLMQALMRNPIADPGMLGVNAGAALGVVLGLTFFGISGISLWIIAALAGAAGAMGLLLLLAGSRVAGATPLRLTLAGIALAAVISGITQAIILTHERVLDLFRFWRVGSLTARSLTEATPVLWCIGAGVVLALTLARGLNVSVLGDELAVSLGARPALHRLGALAAITLLCGGATALAGPISFVGLLAPRVAQRMVGDDHRYSIPLAGILAAVLLLVADILGRVAGGGAEVQVGVMMALLGGPVLILLVGGPLGRRVRS